MVVEQTVVGQEVRREKKNLSFLYFLFASALESTLSLSLSLQVTIATRPCFGSSLLQTR